MAEQTILKKRSFVGPFLGMLLMVGAPTAAAFYYYYFIAVDRFVSEFRYSVRGGAIMLSKAPSRGLVIPYTILDTRNA